MWSSNGYKIDKEICDKTYNAIIKLASIDQFGIVAELPAFGLCRLALTYEGCLRIEYKDVYLYLEPNKKIYQKMKYLWNKYLEQKQPLTSRL
jgi:hypothetical protein